VLAQRFLLALAAEDGGVPARAVENIYLVDLRRGLLSNKITTRKLLSLIEWNTASWRPALAGWIATAQIPAQGARLTKRQWGSIDE
jgi:hypothetical protein